MSGRAYLRFRQKRKHMKHADKLSLLQGRERSPWLPPCPTIYQAALFATIVFLCGIAGGCASIDHPYWQHVNAAYPVVSIEEVDHPEQLCKRFSEMDGCTVRNNDLKIARIYLRKGLPPALKACTRVHEQRHADGDEHDSREVSDCYPRA